ncbi:neurotrophin 1 [Wyeomyia smithii]|uniref:neurotrophin 1 n=1 Tax=Wyeomyia smithii TaxID=174621 RepID=UPI00246805E6|nr:neurotrophin 1 [Wyeomyia smithii]XP_055534415.1 neurotrophin 1 [Wyeomyia smithii]XP_055534416.1 neurotrophin 1 [Wyeomyia smithii]XP_055534417.1 neurotrophin 1 [Wyeomyia smithii]
MWLGEVGSVVLVTLLLANTVGLIKSDAELPDFDFDSPKGDDQDEYYYVSEGDDQRMQPSHKIISYNRTLLDAESEGDRGSSEGNDASGGPKAGGFLMEDDDTSFELMDDVDFVEDPAASNFQRKQAAMRQIMMRAFANSEMQRKFGEVLPLLKVMSKAQKTTLAALISAQVHSRDGHTMSLEQVKQMFGDRQELILPLVYDVANMIRTVAKKESLLNERYPTEEEETIPANQLLRRSFSVRPEPSGFKVNTVETADSNLKDDRLMVDIKEDDVRSVRDSGAKSDEQSGRSMTISDVPMFEALVQSFPRFSQQLTRAKGDKEERMSFHERKLNMTAFNSTRKQKDQLAMPSDGPIPITLPKASAPGYSKRLQPATATTTAAPAPEVTTLTMEEIEDLALSGLNGTELDALEKSGVGSSNGSGPVAELLIGGFRNRPSDFNKIHMLLPNEKCDHFSTGVCIRVENYPESQILNSITRHKSAMGALLAEYIDKTNEFDKNAFEPEEIESGINTKLTKRSDDPSKSGGGMCPSIIRYARPQKARSATGEWKYIVNTGEHTQTLRLEKCTTPQDSCTYLTDNFRSRCVQIYNYHRLLSWDTARGLHVDIFKVPTCCSCHIDGYRESFPPLSNFNNEYDSKSESFEDPSLAASNFIKNTHYSTLKFDNDEPENVQENIAYHFANGFQRMKPPKYENALLVPPSPPPHFHKNRFERPKMHPKKPSHPHYMPSQVLDTYLSPPPNDVGFHIPFKRGPHFTNDNSLKRTVQVQPNRNRLPVRKQINVNNDQNIAETDIRINQVQVVPPVVKNDRLPPTQAPEKHRKRFTTPPTIHKKEKPHHFRIPHQKPAPHTTDATPFVPVTTPTTTTTTAATTNGHQRINYNYHPIIDFFGEVEAQETPSEPIDRIGRNSAPSSSSSSSSLNSWKPVLHGPGQRPMRIPI